MNRLVRIMGLIMLLLSCMFIMIFYSLPKKDYKEQIGYKAYISDKYSGWDDITYFGIDSAICEKKMLGHIIRRILVDVEPFLLLITRMVYV